ncbi:MAG: CRISPR-associated endonuclease Cas2 [Desulfohalobiaceae bacterium]
MGGKAYGDITRDKVAKVLKGYGQRLQKSAFECPELSERRFLQLKDKLEGLIDHTQDSVRFYRQCKGCLKDFEHCGIGEAPEVKSFQIV